MIKHRSQTNVMVIRTAVVVLAVLASLSAWAAEIEPLRSPLSTTYAHDPILVLDGGSSPLSLSLADLETLPMKESTLRTAFGMEGTFQGVMLDDLLALAHLKTSTSFTVIAADDYAINIGRNEIDEAPPMLATRFNGKPIANPSRGPLILIWPKLEQAVLQGKSDGANWVWSVRKIRGHP